MAVPNKRQRRPNRLGGILGGITDRTRWFDQEPNADVARDNVYESIDGANFQKYVVFVASAGFFTDAYDIFAVNSILPMLSYVYWPAPDDRADGLSRYGMPNNLWTALTCATLAGSVIGQVTFGVLGDLFGRVKMYGILLIMILWATVGLAAAADGSHRSMSIFGWLFFWRFFMGVGIGGDYPLSAVLTSEFAPKQHRSRMLAWVFFMQPLGQLFGTIIAIAVTAGLRSSMQDLRRCSSDDCFQAVDRTWRLIVGIGAVPALVAMCVRIWIPESPRYTMDVLKNAGQARSDAYDYFGSPTTSNHEMVQSPGHNRSASNRYAPSSNNDLPPPAQALSTATEVEKAPVDSQGPQGVKVRPSVSTPGSARRDTRSVSNVNQRQQEPSIWKMCRDWFRRFRVYFKKDGNWKPLAGTMLSWALLDFSFYGLGMSSPKTIQKLFDDYDFNSGPVSVYEILFQNAWHSIVIVSIWALLGGMAMIYVVQNSRPAKVQFVFFVVLGIIFIVTGAIFKPLIASQGHIALIVLYAACQFFFNLGPNATTFIIPAEQFPTEFRCTANGLSAASGKLGSVIVVLGSGLSGGVDGQSDKLGWWLIGLGFAMFLGATITLFWVPDSFDKDGKSMSLETLSKGPRVLEGYRGSWWNTWHTKDIPRSDTSSDV